MTTQVKTRKYQGGTLDELLPKIREELGDDAIVVRQREGLTGGVGGFFQKRCVEVEARAGAAPAVTRAQAPARGGFSVTDGPEATPAPPPPAAAAPPASVVEAMLAQASGTDFGERLVAAQDEQAKLGAEPPPPAAAPTVGSSVSVDDLLAGAAPPAPAHEPVAPPPAAPPRGRVVTSPQVDALPPQRAEASAPPPAPSAPAPPPAAPPVAAGPPVVPAPMPAPAPAPAAEEGARAARAERAIATLADRGLAPAFAEEIVDGVMAFRVPFQQGARLGSLVARELAQRIPVAPLVRPGVTAWVGSGGSGKTSVVAAFARAHAEAGTLPVAVVALQAADEGAALRAALQGTGVDVHAASDDTIAEPLVQWLVASGATVVIDTPAVSPRNAAEVTSLGRRLQRLGAQDIHLCIPATVGAQVARDVLEGTSSLAPTALTITHGDETERLGAAVQLAIDSGLPISFVSEAGATGRGLRAADPAELAKVLAG
jgi:flagellar biosynthesis GTPase FlhF